MFTESLQPALRKINEIWVGLIALLPNLGIALLVGLLFLFLAWTARRSVKALFMRRGRRDLGSLMGGFVSWLVVLFGALTIATIIFPSVKPSDALATLGIGSVAVGFAFKDILQNLFSGLLLLYKRPFRRDDQIVSGEYEGIVERIEARATIIKTYDGQRVVIPNSDIYTRAVTVRTAYPYRRSDYTVGIGYGDNLEEACALIVETLKGVNGVLETPAPEALPWALESSTVNIKARWWTSSLRTDVVHTHARVILALKMALDKAGIDIAYPTQVVLFHDQTEETDGDRTRQREGWPMGRHPPKPRQHINVQLEKKNG